MRFYPFLLLLASACFAQTSAYLTGLAINTTNPERPVAARMTIRLAAKSCTLTISPPLSGSGPCLLKSFDKQSGRLEIISAGAATIAWTGVLKGNFASGTYKIGDGQTGSFYVVIANGEPETKPKPARTRQSDCAPSIESAITGDVEGWSGDTLFKLDNGQIWQQSDYDYTYFYEFHPAVTIYETAEGCKMKVEGESDTVIVKRIR